MQYEPARLEAILEGVYERFHDPALIHPDPLELVRPYDDPADREVAALVASSLAYGRVEQILRSVGAVLDALGPSPHLAVTTWGRDRLDAVLDGFVHRFTRGDELARLLHGAGQLLDRDGSLEQSLLRHLSPHDETVLRAACGMVDDLLRLAGLEKSYLLPSPAAGSACKRLNLMLRWLVRADSVDPGGWSVDPRLLVVPLDVHMHRIALRLGLTSRRTADGKTALEVTRAFRAIRPEDPVRYDFSLTRLGIREGDYELLWAR